ncbi:uncharacterized protein N7479_005961 [Penicillium vulpinum]|uniref:Uncharacterized protein n=1 Tax=Penicillium vulpinum TaxID=29845 RepID=A0A1V6SG20_9EURO|nr:uncharacterized protein N7479_005961 [Penicillium vulpinum]KAJ5958811.1 hypothetical protein N7479_005961 [Penicillium vulpinum]OQE12709.1 hypothetical protein PENVUL_c001G07147 [Penicillium vulpinum]
MAQHDYEAMRENDSLPVKRPNARWSTWRAWMISPWQTIGFMSILGIAAIIWTLPSILSTYNAIDSATDSQSSLFQCGESAAEALARGCKFDIMSFAWVPEPCFDRELMEEFLELRQWKWYADKDGQEVESELDIREGQYPEMFVSWEYHLVHCAYMWRKMHRALLKGGVDAVDGYVGSMHHTEHCSGMLLEYRQEAVNITNSWVYAKYPACGKGAFQLNKKGWYRIVDGNKMFSIPTHEDFAPL